MFTGLEGPIGPGKSACFLPPSRATGVEQIPMPQVAVEAHGLATAA